MKRLGASVDWSREYFTMDERSQHRRQRSLRPPLRAGPHLSRRLHRQLGPHPADRRLRPRSRNTKSAWASSTTSATHSPIGPTGDQLYHHRHHPPRDHARRRRRSRQSQRRALQAPHRHASSGFRSAQRDREIPIIADDWANPEFGTGAVKVTPAHDPNDFAIGQRHNLRSQHHHPR